MYFVKTFPRSSEFSEFVCWVWVMFYETDCIQNYLGKALMCILPYFTIFITPLSIHLTIILPPVCRWVGGGSKQQPPPPHTRRTQRSSGDSIAVVLHKPRTLPDLTRPHIPCLQTRAQTINVESYWRESRGQMPFL